MKTTYELVLEHHIYGRMYLLFESQNWMERQKEYYRKNGWKIEDVNIRYQK